jgi:acetyl-CoA C-acetyltransferase
MKKFQDSKDDVVLVGGVRTPFGKFGGTLKDVESVDLGATVIKELLKRTKVPGSAIDEVFYGFSMLAEPQQDSKGDVPDRRAVLKAGLPPETPSMSLHKACCSSLVAVQMAFRAIKLGEDKVVIAMGAENMGRVPLLISAKARWGTRLGHMQINDPIYALGYADWNPVSVDTGQVALENGVSREEQDAWALRSQQRFAKADAEGKFKDEIMSIEVPQAKGNPIMFSKDEPPRPNTTLEDLAKLKTVYGSPTITAGNAPGLDAGACALLIMTREKAKEFGLTPMATIVSAVTASMEARFLAAVPAPTIEKALKVADVTLDDIKLIEINEAFAALPLVSSKILAEKYYGGDKAKLAELREKINVNGGCIACGHPVGVSGARIMMTLANELKRRGGGLGVCAICGGLAQGAGVVIRVD